MFKLIKRIRNKVTIKSIVDSLGYSNLKIEYSTIALTTGGGLVTTIFGKPYITFTNTTAELLTILDLIKVRPLFNDLLLSNNITPTDTNIVKFVILHEIGHYMDVVNNKFTSSDWLEPSLFIQSHKHFNLTDLQKAYRLFPTESSADSFAINLLK